MCIRDRLGPKTTLLDAFKSVNGVLQGAVQGIADLITRPGLINVDFADVRTVMGETGMAMMGSGLGTGEDRARTAAQMAVSSPLLEDVNLSGARGILVNVTAGMDLAIGEFEEVGNIVREFASEDATVVVGTVIDPELGGPGGHGCCGPGAARSRRRPAPHDRHGRLAQRGAQDHGDRGDGRLLALRGTGDHPLGGGGGRRPAARRHGRGDPRHPDPPAPPGRLIRRLSGNIAPRPCQGRGG